MSDVGETILETQTFAHSEEWKMKKKTSIYIDMCFEYIMDSISSENVLVLLLGLILYNLQKYNEIRPLARLLE